MLYTDGLTDAYAPAADRHARGPRGGARARGGRPASEITSGVTSALLGLDGEHPRDDIALLVLRVPPVAVPPEQELS